MRWFACGSTHHHSSSWWLLESYTIINILIHHHHHHHDDGLLSPWSFIHHHLRLQAIRRSEWQWAEHLLNRAEQRALQSNVIIFNAAAWIGIQWLPGDRCRSRKVWCYRPSLECVTEENLGACSVELEEMNCLQYSCHRRSMFICNAWTPSFFELHPGWE